MLFRALFRLLFWALVPVVAYFVVAAAGAVIPQRTADVPASGDTQEIILVAGLIHYDILLPADDATRAAFGFVEEAGVPLSHPMVR